MKPVDVLNAGARDLAAAVVPEGFTFVGTGAGQGSGGEFASGAYRRDDRRLELSFRNSLGLVTYRVGEVMIGHEEYIRAVRALDQIDASPAYPGFHQEPAAQFAALREDLQVFGARFLRGSLEQFQELRRWLDGNPKPTGFAALSR
jgi:hypothetical protein